MKQYTGINLLCALILLIMAAGVSIPIYQFGKAFSYGFTAGYEAEEESMETDFIPVEIAFEPTKSTLIEPQDSIKAGNGKSYPVVYSRGVIMTSVSNGLIWPYVARLILNLAILCITVILMIQFIKLIISINKGIVFDAYNAKRLAKIGYLLLIASLFHICEGLTESMIISKIHADTQFYTLSPAWIPPMSDLMLGFFSLMLASIWRRGLEMQKEQELTI